MHGQFLSSTCWKLWLLHIPFTTHLIQKVQLLWWCSGLEKSTLSDHDLYTYLGALVYINFWIGKLRGCCSVLLACHLSWRRALTCLSHVVFAIILRMLLFFLLLLEPKVVRRMYGSKCIAVADGEAARKHRPTSRQLANHLGLVFALRCKDVSVIVIATRKT